MMKERREKKREGDREKREGDREREMYVCVYIYMYT